MPKITHLTPARRALLASVGVASAALLLAVACGKSGGGEAKAAPAQGAPAGSAADQVAMGGKLYGQHCAGCHGDGGQGSDKAPMVVGVAKGALPLDPKPGAKRNVQFHTALDIGKWVMANMPGSAPGSLKPEEYLAILAFDLTANGVKLDAPLTVDNAAAIVIHP